MGYTHYWKRCKAIDRRQFDAVAGDFRRVVPVLESLGVQLAGSDGTGDPTIGGDEIALNGVRFCGHARRQFGIAWPEERARGVSVAYHSNGDQGSDVGCQWFGGRKILSRTCGGDCSHESFWFPRVHKDETSSRYFDFCKTAFKPYDLAVQVCLVIASHHLGNRIEVTSDGESDLWVDAISVCKEALGYGDEFRLSG